MTTEQSTERREPRTMLALIALATDLPMPTGIRFSPHRAGLSLDLPCVADGQAWSSHLGGKTDTYINNDDGRRYLSEGVIQWQGWRVQLHASDPPAQPDTPLDEDTAARLAALAEQQEPVVVDLDDCAREVAAELRTAHQ